MPLYKYIYIYIYIFIHTHIFFIKDKNKEQDANSSPLSTPNVQSQLNIDKHVSQFEI